MSVDGVAKRRRHGRGWSYTIGGETVDSVTRVCREGVPARGLIDWAARSVAGYALDHWAELSDEAPSKRLATLTKAANAERDAAAGRGSDVHALAEQLAHGAEVDVPDAIRGHVDGYLAFVDAYRVVDVAVEVTVVHRGATLASSYMGTADLLAQLDGSDDVVLVDWKTGGSGIWPETALQLAAYAHAQTMLTPEGDEIPLPPVARAVAVWLRADGYDVYPVDISDATFRTFQYAQQVAAFTGAPRERYVRDALPARAVVES